MLRFDKTESSPDYVSTRVDIFNMSMPYNVVLDGKSREAEIPKLPENDPAPVTQSLDSR